jgi:lipopolysaccharide/colanic/teichoic acid biosynthesis glycosyltransferase
MHIRLRRQRAETEPISHDNAKSPGKRTQRRIRSPMSERTPSVSPGGRWYLPCKAVVDFVAACFLLVPAVPLILLAALLVKLTSRGPAYYTQTRLGKGGRLFTIYKIRTMIHKCESLTGPRWSIPGDPRITLVGQVLRRTHLDELPQLFNVLGGDMSLIGPRPERPEFLPELEAAFPCYRDRLVVRPGVTGLAQVQLPADSDLDSVREKLRHDLYYIQHLSFWLDLRILVCTAFYAFGVPFHVTRRLCGVPTGAVIDAAVEVAEPETAPRRPRKTA